MTDSPAPKNVDVVIIGGGITGASCLYHLAEATNLGVLLVEARTLNSGSTSRSAAAFRHQFSSRTNIRMSVYSSQLYERLAGETNTEPLLVRNGYLFLCSSEKAVQQARQRRDVQRQEGVTSVQFLSTEQIHNRFTYLASAPVLGGTWCPEDGFIRPKKATRTFIQAALEHGNTYYRENTPVTDVTCRNERVHSVDAGGQKIRFDFLVNAAGIWGPRIAEQAGVTLPVAPVKRYLYRTAPLSDRNVSECPMTVRDLGPYLRPDGNSLLMGWDRKPEPPEHPENYWSTDRSPDQLFTRQNQTEEGYGLGSNEYGQEILNTWTEWIPFLKQASLTKVQSGYYQMTPDQKAIVSGDPRVSGLFHAVGFSGHGIMHAPATGRIVTDLVLDRDPLFDLAPLSLEPFLNGRERPDPEEMVL